MRQPYNNKANFDPGRFRFKLEFYDQISEDDSSGGSQPFTAKVLTTKGIQEPIRDGSQLAIEAGASQLNQDCYFIIRNRSDFTVTKNHIIVSNGTIAYVIAAIIPIDVPVNYIKILCKTKE